MLRACHSACLARTALARASSFSAQNLRISNEKNVYESDAAPTSPVAIPVDQTDLLCHS